MDIEEENREEEIEPTHFQDTENPEGADLPDGAKVMSLTGMYESWFLEYASYVILERAVPEVKDGLKPVQRRILHSMKEIDDGRYNKVANIIGHTMKYHPHGDASIGDALVQMGQKDLLIDCQGNWGNILTGDSSAAPRYIEARLSKFAHDVVFNPKTTNWKLSYDGRNKEPLTLPVKFPLLLAQGSEGIAVGLSSKILPHNFIELIDASVNLLKGVETDIYPDFPTGGMADFSKYNDGQRGGRIRVRAKINQLDKKTLVINEIPFGTTTSSLIDSVISANDKGKIKIRKIEDNTAENVEILVHLAPGISPDQTIDALYAFTTCEISISPNCCVIQDEKPRFIGVKEVLRTNTDNTVALLKLELEIQLAELQEQWHFSSLEKIFIEKRIYRKIEECETWEAVIEAIDLGLKPYRKLFFREITRDDIIRLTEIKIKRISRYDIFKADEIIKSIEDDIKTVKHHLEHLIDYAIAWYERIKDKYGKGRERRTEIRNFDYIEASMVAVANEKLYVNREEGFIGTSLRKDEIVGECSDIDEVIVIRNDGTFLVTRVTEKSFVGKGIHYVAVFKRNDERTIYNLVYQDGKTSVSRIKRFAIVGITRDKEYDLTAGKPGSRILYLTANPNGEAEIIRVKLKAKPRLKKLFFDVDFSEIAIKGRASIGNILSKYAVFKISLKEDGVSTLGAREIWFDEAVKRLNVENRGVPLGAFLGDDRILTIMQSGDYKLHNFDLSTHFDDDLLLIRKYSQEQVWTCVFFDGNTKLYYVKRFQIEPTDKKTNFILEHPESKLIFISDDRLPRIEMIFDPSKAPKNRTSEVVELASFIDVKGVKARGKRISNYAVSSFNFLEPVHPENELEWTVVSDVMPEENEIVADEVIETTELPEDSILDESESLPETEPTQAESDVAQSPSLPPPDIKEIQPRLDLAIEEITPPPAIKKTRKPSTKSKEKPLPGVKSVSLDRDEPLQMELDF